MPADRRLAYANASFARFWIIYHEIAVFDQFVSCFFHPAESGGRKTDGTYALANCQTQSIADATMAMQAHPRPVVLVEKDDRASDFSRKLMTILQQKSPGANGEQNNNNDSAAR